MGGYVAITSVGLAFILFAFADVLKHDPVVCRYLIYIGAFMLIVGIGCVFLT
jgi:hypothetical protein